MLRPTLRIFVGTDDEHYSVGNMEGTQKFEKSGPLIRQSECVLIVSALKFYVL